MKNTLRIVLVVIIVLAILFPIFYPLLFASRNEVKYVDSEYPQPQIKSYDPPFKKEGELEILDESAGKVIQKISIEIADNEKEITQGLMYRSTMPDTAGMLFIFKYSTHHDFWMKNTKMPLDIIFIDEQQKIVTIQRNTTPYSEKLIPSEKPILYVLEVKAGFSDRHGIKVGNLVRFNRINA